MNRAIPAVQLRLDPVEIHWQPQQPVAACGCCVWKDCRDTKLTLSTDSALSAESTNNLRASTSPKNKESVMETMKSDLEKQIFAACSLLQAEFKADLEAERRLRAESEAKSKAKSEADRVKLSQMLCYTHLLI
jgi:hypothetical protein